MWGRLRGMLILVVLCSIASTTGVWVGAAAGQQPPNHGAVTGGTGALQTATDWTHTTQLATERLPYPPHTPPDEPPLADAGLDQTVPLGATVYLDGGGSLDPDGELVEYDWRVERPNGTRLRHDCATADCVRASFVPSQPGVYNATLTVTDDAGQTATDYLYVTVTEQAPPSATLTGPDTLEVNETGTFRLRGERGDNLLSAVTWRVNGDRTDQLFVDEAGTWEFTRRFERAGSHTVSGTLTDVIGLSDTAQQTVRVEPAADNRFEVRITNTNSPVSEGDTATVTARIENVGEAGATQQISYDGPPAETSRSVTLAGGESTTETFRWETASGDAGEYPVEIRSQNDSASGRIEVTNSTTASPDFDVEIEATNSPVALGDEFSVTATVTNTGGAADEQQVETAVTFGGGMTKTDTVSLAAGDTAEASTGLTASFDTNESMTPGEYEVIVRSDNATARTPLQLINPGSGGTLAVTDISAEKPEELSDSYQFAVSVENVGEESVDPDSTITLSVPGAGKTAAKIRTTTAVEPGETQLLKPDSDSLWVWQDFCGSGNAWQSFSRCSSGVGWDDWAGDQHQFRATTDSWDGDYNENLGVPQLPTFNVSVVDVRADTGITRSVEKYGPQIRVTNEGELPGPFRMEVHITETRYSLGIDPLENEDCSPDCTLDPPIDMGQVNGIELAPGEPWTSHPDPEDSPFGMDPLHEWQQYMDTIEVTADVYPDYVDTVVPDASAEGEGSWHQQRESRACDASDENLNVELSTVQTEAGKEIQYDVYEPVCDGEGGVSWRELRESDYDSQWSPLSEAGRANFDLTDSTAEGDITCGHEDDTIGFAWEIETDDGRRAEVGATWEGDPDRGC